MLRSGGTEPGARFARDAADFTVLFYEARSSQVQDETKTCQTPEDFLSSKHLLPYVKGVYSRRPSEYCICLWRLAEGYVTCESCEEKGLKCEQDGNRAARCRACIASKKCSRPRAYKKWLLAELLDVSPTHAEKYMDWLKLPKQSSTSRSRVQDHEQELENDEAPELSDEPLQSGDLNIQENEVSSSSHAVKTYKFVLEKRPAPEHDSSAEQISPHLSKRRAIERSRDNASSVQSGNAPAAGRRQAARASGPIKQTSELRAVRSPSHYRPRARAETDLFSTASDSEDDPTEPEPNPQPAIMQTRLVPPLKIQLRGGSTQKKNSTAALEVHTLAELNSAASTLLRDFVSDEVDDSEEETDDGNCHDAVHTTDMDVDAGEDEYSVQAEMSDGEHPMDSSSQNQTNIPSLYISSAQQWETVSIPEANDLSVLRESLEGYQTRAEHSLKQIQSLQERVKELEQRHIAFSEARRDAEKSRKEAEQRAMTEKRLRKSEEKRRREAELKLVLCEEKIKNLEETERAVKRFCAELKS